VLFRKEVAVWFGADPGSAGMLVVVIIIIIIIIIVIIIINIFKVA